MELSVFTSWRPPLLPRPSGRLCRSRDCPVPLRLQCPRGRRTFGVHWMVGSTWWVVDLVVKPLVSSSVFCGFPSILRGSAPMICLGSGFFRPETAISCFFTINVVIGAVPTRLRLFLFTRISSQTSGDSQWMKGVLEGLLLR